MSDKVYETKYMQLGFSAKGTITSLIDKSDGQDYLAREEDSLFITLEDGGDEQIGNLHIDENLLRASFPSKDVEVTFQVIPEGGYLAFKLLGINRHDFKWLQMGKLKISITETPARDVNACYDKKFLVAVMPLSLQVNSVFDGASSQYTTLGVQCFPQFGIMGARFAIVGCPPNKFLDLVDEIQRHFKIPRCVKSLRSESARKSYIFTAGGPKEEDADAIIQYAKKGCFGTVMLGMGDWTDRRGGHYTINKNSFPDGIAGLKRMGDKLHRAGLEFGLHNAACAIIQWDNYIVSPSPYLYVQGMHVLAEDIDENTDTIPVLTPSPEALRNPAVVGQTSEGTVYDNVIRIGNEIIRFNRLEGPPYRLLGCQRGQSSTHEKGEFIEHLKLLFAKQFAPAMGTPLTEEIAQRLADVANFCEVDFIYSDYAEISQGWHPGGAPEWLNEAQSGNWYYTAKFLLDLYERMENSNVLFQSSLWAAGSGFSWHFSPRSCFMNGGKDIKRNIDERISAPIEICNNFKIAEIGWCRIITEDPSYYTPSDFEYICKKAIGFEGTISIHASLKTLAKRPDTEEILATIAKYRRLQEENRFSEDEKEHFRKAESSIR